MKTNFIATLIACCLFSTSLIGQQAEMPLFTTTAIKDASNKILADSVLSTRFKNFSVVSFPVRVLGNYLQLGENENKFFRLQIDSSIFDLQLRPSNIAGTGFKLTVQTASGLVTSHPVTENIFYRGIANNNVNNTVRLTLTDGLVSGFIQKEGKEIFIESLSNYIEGAAPDEVVIYSTADIIATGNYTCGVTERAGMMEKAVQQLQQQQALESLQPESVTCKKLKFVFLADYTMFTFFNEDITALQNKMLAILNNAQGAYTGLNFGADTTTDIGTDELNFEMSRLYVSTCYNCDIILGNETFNQGGTTVKVRAWVKSNTDTTSSLAAIYWTKKQMYLGNTANTAFSGIMIDRFSTCSQARWALMGCMYAPGDAYLKQMTAHELGHALGCYHDNAFIPSVTGFIMNSSITPNAIAMTSFADLPGAVVYGKPYSSKMAIRNGITNLEACLVQCDNNFCEPVENLQANNFPTGDSILVTWQGAGAPFAIRVREKSNPNAPYIIATNTSESRIVLHGLQRCAFYLIEVQNLCGKKTSVTISTSLISAKFSKVIHVRADLHDVEINVEKAVNFLQDSLRITVDHMVKWYGPKKLPAMIVLKDIFSDGARHRIDFYEGSGLRCRSTIFYQAPYFRKEAVTLAAADFNTCAQPLGWKDSIFRTVPYVFGTYIPKWNYKKVFSSYASILIPDGTLDSSCMIYFDNNQPSIYFCQGSIGLTSPEMNLSDYRNTYLSFDYKQNIRSPGYRKPFFKAEGFDGVKWVTIFDAAQTRTLTPFNSYTFWDTVPARPFVSLDRFSNRDFKVRFVVEDSVSYDPIRPYVPVFIALDNIRIDGFPVNSISKQPGIRIFPNPVRDEIFVKTDLLSEQPTHYRITDATGKLIENKPLKNYRINVERLSSALYFIQFYFKEKGTTEVMKFIKY